MEYLYKIKDIVVLDPMSPSLDLVLDGVDSDFAQRIKGYIADRIDSRFGFEYSGEEYRFYNLSDKDVNLKNLMMKNKKSNN